MGLTGGDLLVPPVGTGGDTVTDLGTGAREAGTGDGSGLLTVPQLFRLLVDCNY